jgi:hypothetical protein
MAEDNSNGTDGSDTPSAKYKPIVEAIDIFSKKYEVAQGDRTKHDGKTLFWAQWTGIGVAVYTVLTLLIAIVAICGTHIA